MVTRALQAWREAARALREGLGLRSSMPAERRYHAFIAYSWSDAALASAVQSGLQRLAKPWYRTRALRVFRDATGLPAGSGLRQTLRAALEDSDYLILIASRASAASKHVQREVAYWRDSKDLDRLLIALAEGTLRWDDARGDYSEESWAVLPEPLRGAFTGESLHVDFTKVAPRELTLANDRFRDAVCQLAARPHGARPDELTGREVAERRRTVRYARLAGLVLVALAVVALVAGVVAIVQRDNAVAQSHVALSRQIDAEAKVVRGKQPDLALLLGVQALRAADTAEARSSLLGLLLAEPWLVRFLYGPHSPVLAMSYYGPGEAELITVHQDGEVIDWNTQRGTGRRIAQLGPIAEALIAKTTVAVVRGAGSLNVYQLPTTDAGGAAPTRLFSARPRVRCDPVKLSACGEGLLVAISEEGSRLVTDLEGTHLEFWEVEQRRRAARQPPTYLSAPAYIPVSPGSEEETLIAVRHHFTSSAASLSPATPPDELLSWPLTGGRASVVARLRVGHTAQHLTGPLVTEDYGGSATAADDSGLLTVEPVDQAGTPPSITQELEGGEASIVSLLQESSTESKIIYLDSGGTVGFIDSLTHTGARMVSGLTALAQQPLGGTGRRRLAMDPGSAQIAVAGGSQGVVLLHPPIDDAPPLVGTPVGASTDEQSERVPALPPGGLPVFSHDGSILAATLDGTEGIGLWRTDTGATVSVLEYGHPTDITKISIASDDRTVAFIVDLLAGRSLSGYVRIWDGLADGRSHALALPLERGDYPTACAFAAGDPRRLVVGTGRGWLYFWNPLTETQWRSPIRFPPGPQASVVLLGASEAGKLFVGVAGGVTLLVHERTGLVHRAPSPSGAIAEAFSPDGKLAAGRDDTGEMRVWVPQTGRTVPGELPVPPYIEEGAVTLGESVLAVTSGAAITLYDTSALLEVGQISASGATEIAFSPTDQALAEVKGTEGTVLATDPKSLVNRACAIANRELTRAEWAQFVGSALPYSATCPAG